MKKRLFLFLFMCVIVKLGAQTDMTDRIVNPSFEDKATGWDIRKMSVQGNDAFNLKVGKYYVESWRPPGDRAQDCSGKQMINNLPAGTYTVTAVAQNIQQNDPSAPQTGVWIYANGDKIEVSQPGDYKVTTTTVDGTLEIGFLIKGATGNYVCVDNFRLTQEVPTEETYKIFREEIGKLVKEGEELNKHLSTPEQVALDEALADGKALINNTSTKDVIEVCTALRTAIFNYRFSLASSDNPLDMTSYMKNPGFEDSTKDWINSGFGSQTNTAFNLKVGTYYCEIWGAINDSEIYQYVNLPNGNYRLTVVGQNVQQSNMSAEQSGAYVYANDVKAKVSFPRQYSLNFVVVDKVAKIGFNTLKCTGNYVCVDDFHLYYLGCDEDAQFAAFNQMITNGEALMSSHQHADSLAFLTQAVEEAKEVTDVKDIAAHAATLRKAIAASQVSVAEYESLLVAIRAAEKTYADGAGNEAEAFKAVLDEANGLYTAAKSIKAEIDRMIKELSQAELLYCVANPSGTVPTVQTYSFVPRGATGALGRLNVTGVPASNIKLQGYCWATHKEPTLADDYVTEGEQLFNYPGLIYIMEPLEPATVYYVRAFAVTKTNAVGYGEVRKIITLPMGQCTWYYANNGEASDNERLNVACAGAMHYYNNWTSIRDYGISVSYDAGDGSAHGSYGGWITVGPNAGYQRIGTVMHEANHGIGVGQHWRWGWEELKASTRWKGLYPTEMPKIEPGIWWQGDQANLVVDFLTNGQDLCNGDGAHMGPFGINGSGAEFRLLYIANALQTQGLGEDGLPPSGGSPTPYYSYESEDDVKYYITCEDKAYGCGSKYLTETSAGVLTYRSASADELANDDAFAWHLVFQPQTCYYLIRNAKSGKYFTFRSGSIRTAEVAEPGEMESFHLMKGRVPVILGGGENTINTKGYWICEGKRRLTTPPALQAGASGSVTTVSEQNFSNVATNQRWVILTADQVRSMEEGKVALSKDKLRRYVAGAKEMIDIAHSDVVENASADFASLTSRMETAVENLISETELIFAIDEMYTGITTFMANTVPEKMSAYDMTFLIENADMESLDGWICSDAPFGLVKNICEVRGSTFDLNQTLSQMPKGVYSLGVQAFQRPGSYTQVGKDYVAGKDSVSTVLYLRSNVAKINNIMAGGQENRIGTASQCVTQGVYIPNSTGAAADYLAEQVYDNSLVVNIKTTVNLKLGLRSGKTFTSDWVAFDKFSLLYYGTNTTVDEVTDIDGIEQDTKDEIQHIYDLSGRVVNNPTQRGVYIVNGKKKVIL